MFSLIEFLVVIIYTFMYLLVRILITDDYQNKTIVVELNKSYYFKNKCFFHIF